jgi:hypothetical protein
VRIGCTGPGSGASPAALASAALTTVLIAFAFMYWAAFIQTIGASSYDPHLLDGWPACWPPT